MGLKKGPWTAAEDQVLAAYVREYGEGSWNAVGKNTGLARCGKSCRLRWANHLRPNLRKGSFSPEEERLIIRLHSQLGNKWARMASQLPGRTDNEIKNYWNTRLKKLQRQGLPLYPPDIVSTDPIHPQHQQQHYFYQPPSARTTTAATMAVYPSSFTFETTTQLNRQSPSTCPSPTTPIPPPPFSPTLPLFAVPESQTTTVATTASNFNNANVFSFSRQPPTLKQPFRFDGFRDNNDGSNFIASSSSMNSRAHSNGVLSAFSQPTNYTYTSLLTLPNSSSSSNLTQTQVSSSVSSNNSVYPDQIEFPSNQNSQHNMMESFDQTHNQMNSGIPESDCRLLEEMLEATHGMVGNLNRRPKRKQVLEQPEENNVTRRKPNEEASIRLSAIEEDMAKMFDAMPATMRSWFSDDGELSNRQSSTVTDDLVLDVQNLASLFSVE